MCVPKSWGGMGFHDIRSFNLAMLAKQCWRPIDNYDSLCAKVLRSTLCAKVLRSKYYPSGDLLNCALKKGSSYTWQSIWSGIQTFKKGCIWRVGNGLKINIWDDCLFPSSTSRKIITVRGNCVLTTVNELIDPTTGDWDELLIRDIFWHIDTERILQIPLFQHYTDDFVAWHLTKSGVFSVRSAYYR